MESGNRRPSDERSTAATGIAMKLEADWLAQKMTQALIR
jgi:hypothetical protein